jgi:hypothetical protein
MRVMEPALNALHRSLQGDPGARSFLDRTCSIYVLDATDITNPKTYACWNFIQQALNEIERVESAAAAASQQDHDNDDVLVLPHELQAHVQLLSTMALRVARRSNAIDKELVATCISNAAKYTASHHECQRLIDLNLELRDIVMGRIAAMAFDDSFHRPNTTVTSTTTRTTRTTRTQFTATTTTTSTTTDDDDDQQQQQQPSSVYRHPHRQNHPSSSSSSSSSAFSDYQVMETFCAVLAANAVSNGPTAVHHLVMEWMVPSSQSLPPYALACVTLHLAEEALRKSAPAGTQDMLQRLSNSVMAFVLAPILRDAIKEEEEEEDESFTNENTSAAAAATGGGGGGRSSSNTNFLSLHERNNRIASVCLRAMDRWCTATDLSLAQIKHICSKVQVRRKSGGKEASSIKDVNAPNPNRKERRGGWVVGRLLVQHTSNTVYSDLSSFACFRRHIYKCRYLNRFCLDLTLFLIRSTRWILLEMHCIPILAW